MMYWIVPLALVAVFVLVLVFALAALARAGVFSPFSQVVVAVCVAALSVVSLLHVLAGRHGAAEGPPAGTPMLEAVLLPYAALALTLLLLVLLLAISRVIKHLRSGTGGLQDRRASTDSRESTTGRNLSDKG